MILYLIIGLVFSGMTLQDCQNAYPGELVGSRGDFCYIYKGTMYWKDAEAQCMSIGGHLPSIHSEDENNFLVSFVEDVVGVKGTVNRFWLGLHDSSQEGKFVWSDGTDTDYLKWTAGEPNDSGNNEDYAEGNWNYPTKEWNDIPNEYDREVVCQVMTCTNYEGGYQKGVKQCGFDDEQFKSTNQDEGITAIDEILEDMETDFENEAAQYEQDLQTSFNNKENSYNAVVAAENEYKNKMADRIAQEGLYNQARVAEEVAHSDLIMKIQAYNDAVTAYSNKHADYTEKIDFLNYELFIIQQIRELLGAQIGYTPVQVVLELTPYDATYEGWATGYPQIMRSTFDHEGQRFGQKRRRKRAGKRKQKKRPGPPPPGVGKRRRRRR